MTSENQITFINVSNKIPEKLIAAFEKMAAQHGITIITQTPPKSGIIVPNNAKEIGKTCQVLRETLGKSQREIADAIKTGKTAINRFEKGENSPTAKTISKISDALGQNTKILFTPKNDEDISPT